MAAVDKRFQLQESGTALDGVEAAKDGVEQVTVVRMLLQVHQLLGQLFENFSSLNQEVLEDLFVGI
jgi:hypothetical protein